MAKTIEEKREYKRRWVANNPEKVSVYNKKYYSEKKEQVLETQKKYRGNSTNFFVIMLSEMKSRSKKRKHDIDPDVTVEYLEQLWKDSNNICALSGVEMTFKRKTKNLVSPDRIDSSLGYIKGNIQFVTQQANRCKLDMTQEEFDTLILNLYNARFVNV